MNAKPRRMQLSRQAGFNLQEASKALNGLPAKRVTRPGPWGNPFVIADVAKTYRLDAAAAQIKAVENRSAGSSRAIIWPAGASRGRPATAKC